MKNKRKAIVIVGALSLVLLLGLSLNAQTYKSAMKGHITDEDGNPLPGVTVTVNSPSEITKDLSMVTNTEGHYHFTSLTPGEYEVTAKLEGFATIIRTGVRLHVGEVAVIDFTMGMATLEESVTVVADSPLVETAKSSMGEVIDSTYIESLPILNRNFMDLATLAAGAAKDPASGRIAGSGERMRSMNVIIDGITNNDNVANFGQILVDQYIQDSIEEFEVMTSGYNAEYGEAAGAVINMITKSGSNTLKGNLFFYHRNDALDASPIKDQDPALLKRYEYGFTVGGPIVRDKVWFFAATQFVNQKEGVEYDFSIVPEELKYDFFGRPENFDAVPKTNDATYFLKLTASLGKSNKMTASVMHFPNEKTNWVGDLRSGQPIGGGILPSAGHTVKIPGWQFKFNLSTMLSNSLFLETNLGYLTRKDVNEPNVTETPAEYFPNFTSGRAMEDPREFNNQKFQWSEDLTFNVDNMAGNHTFKTGFRFINDHQTGYILIHNAVLYATDSRDFPILTQSFVPVGRGLSYDVVLRSYGAYVQDSWEVMPNLVLNFGLRFDRMSPWNHNQLAPRFGFSWDPFQDNKTVIRGHIGRFYDHQTGNALLLDENYGGIGYIVKLYWGLAEFLGGPPAPGIEVPPSEIRFLETPFKTPYSDAWSIGIEREIIRDLSLSLEFTDRNGRDIYSQRVVNWKLDNTGTTDGGVKRRAIGYDNWADYTSFHISLQKKFSHGFQFLTSYTWSRWRDTAGDNFNNTPEDPNDISKDYGPAQYDIPHKFVLSGSAQLPFGFTLGALVTIQSGLPYSAAALADKNNDGRLDRPDDPVAEKRNPFRTPTYSSVDVRLGKTFMNNRFSLFIEAFNLLNHKNVWTVYNNWTDQETFGDAITYFHGRVVQLAVRVNF
ncbi:MAG: TonB-dependent receptor [Candidatus Aminicenantes bacterium]|nr:TonB-dependent receptor [Candidatus Aminicenantes bacterium]